MELKFDISHFKIELVYIVPDKYDFLDRYD